jgi:hypothetical protein
VPLGAAAALAQPAAEGPPALPDAAAVRDTLDAVFRSGAFDRPWGQVVWERFLDLVRALAASARDGALASPVAFWLAVALATVVVAYALGRGAAGWDARVRRRRAEGGDARPGDPWRAADAAAAAGHLVDAAHLLHGAVVDALARRGLVRAHRSKTVGDYARELRARAGPSPTAHAAYRDFARRYEPFVYAVGAANAARWDALRAAAEATRDAARAAAPEGAAGAGRPALASAGAA